MLGKENLAACTYRVENESDESDESDACVRIQRSGVGGREGEEKGLKRLFSI